MKGARSILGIGLGFLLALAVVAGVSFLGPTPPTKAVSLAKPTSALASREGSSAGTTSPVTPVVTVSPSSIEGIISSTPSSLLLVLSPVVAALVLGVAVNRLSARRADSE